ncbi:pol protein, partial [Human immunodeficiency virus 1]
FFRENLAFQQGEARELSPEQTRANSPTSGELRVRRGDSPLPRNRSRRKRSYILRLPSNHSLAATPSHSKNRGTANRSPIRHRSR